MSLPHIVQQIEWGYGVKYGEVYYPNDNIDALRYLEMMHRESQGNPHMVDIMFDADTGISLIVGGPFSDFYFRANLPPNPTVVGYACAIHSNAGQDHAIIMEYQARKTLEDLSAQLALPTHQALYAVQTYIRYQTFPRYIRFDEENYQHLIDPMLDIP